MTNQIENGQGEPGMPKQGYVFVIPWDLGSAGGVNQVVENLFREFQNADEFIPRIVVNDWESSSIDEQNIDSRPTARFRLSSPWTEKGTLTWLLKWLAYSPVMFFGILRYCHRHRVNTLNFHYPSLAVFPVAMLKFTRLYRGNLVLSFHGLDLRAVVESSATESRLWRFVLSQCDRIVACSAALATDFKLVSPESTGKIVAIRNGLSLEDLKAEQEIDPDLNQLLCDKTYITSVATFEHKKGLDVLINAFATIHPEFPHVSLILAGRSEVQEASLRQLAETLDLGDSVQFLPNVPHRNIGQLLQNATIFCLPSRSEPFGIVLLEAGAYRLPVVASETGGIPEIVTHGKHGLLVPRDDINLLAEALASLLRDPECARQLGEQLRDRVSEDFGWDRAYREYRSILL